MTNEIEILKRELETLKREHAEKQEIENLQKQIGSLKQSIKQEEFRKKHKKLYNFSQKTSSGIKGFFRAFRFGLKKVGTSLEKSDRIITEQQRREQLNKPKRDSFEDALNSLD